MNKKVRADIATAGYYFTNYPGLIWHSGKWWVNDIETKVVYNNGSLSVMYAGSKLSIRKLRKLAIKCTVNITPLPF